MIQAIELKNFKSIKKHRFSLRNLNVVAGLNGMGKSTFIQSLLLLRQSSNLGKGELNINGPDFSIGSSRDAFYQYSKEDEMIFNVAFTDNVKYKFEFLYKKDTDIFKTKSPTSLEEAFFKQSLFSNKFQYLSANRLGPMEIHEKSYTAVETFRSVGSNGEYTVHFLDFFGSEDIAFDNMIHPKSVNKYLMEQVNRWMGEISPGVKINATAIPGSDFYKLDIQFEQPTLGFTNHFKPPNVGFGISYALPVVTALLAAKPGDLVVIENPESHIHPRGQAELGRLIALASMNDIQVVVETHSDQILNGIRVAVKEKSAVSEKIIFFYFDKKVEVKEQYSEITNIEINANGDLNKYPKNLLEEWGNQLIKLI